ncbi:hypothetical protein [Schleiferilactobacillus harbinensis]|uniref:HTH domain-containing protein n=1 Tax=Schleiferilactobacillus harbinensis TaxID=304207 RepID=A0ABU7T0J5_9LACO
MNEGPTKDQQNQALRTLLEMAENNVPESDPAWNKNREIVGFDRRKPGANKQGRCKQLSHVKKANRPGKPASTSDKRKEMDRRRILLPKLIDRGYNGRQIAEYFGVSKSVIYHDIDMLKLKTRPRRHWRVTNTDTHHTEYYASFGELNAVAHIHDRLNADELITVVGPWRIEYGTWYQDSQGNWYEAPNESL